MSGQVSRGSAGEYQAEERAGVARTGLAGVMINFCTDSACTPVTSGEDGAAVFTGAPEAYHVQVIRIPEGWELEGNGEWTTEARSQDFAISFREAGK